MAGKEAECRVSPTDYLYLAEDRTAYLAKIPSQRRARDTFNRIVSAAVDLLLEYGLAGLNTNAIAERSAVNVASVYSYFRNKESILYFLAEYYENSRVALVAAGTDRIREGADWQETLFEIIDAMVDFRIAQPGCVVVRRAIEALPESPDFDDRSTGEAATALTQTFMDLAPAQSEDAVQKIAFFFTDMVTVTVDRAFATSPHNAQSIVFFKEMSVAWLSSYFGPK